MRAIGIHYANSHFHYVVLNQAGEITLRGKVRANREDLRREFRAIEPTCIAMRWTRATRWAAEMLSSMHHAVMFSAVREGDASCAAAGAHDLSTPVLEAPDFERLAERQGADIEAELHARRLRLQWTRGVARNMRPAAAAAVESAIYI